MGSRDHGQRTVYRGDRNLESVAHSGQSQGVETPQFRYDASWPKPLPEGWVLGSVGSVCVDARDHVFVVTRGEPAPKERNLATPAPPVIEFDADGNVVNSWGNRAVMAKTQHGCFIDKENLLDGGQQLTGRVFQEVHA